MSQYDTTDEKVANIERYLVHKVDRIHRAVMLALGLAAVAAVMSVWTAVRSGGPSGDPDRRGDVAQVSPVPADVEADATTRALPDDDDVGATGSEAGTRDAAPVDPDAGSGAASPVVARGDAPDRARSAEDRSSSALAPADRADRSEATRRADAAPAPPADDEALPPGALFRVGASAIATNIVSLEPVGTGTSFASGTKLFFWTRVETPNFQAVAENDRFVVHRWIHAGETRHERKITVGSPRYRVYSMHEARLPGDWRLEVVDSGGRLLHVERFTIE